MRGTRWFMTAVVLAVASGALATTRTVELWQDPGLDTVTHGRVFIPVAPAEALRAARDVQHWPEIFSDVEWVKVAGTREKPEITFYSRTVSTSLVMVMTEVADGVMRLDLTGGVPGAVGYALFRMVPKDGGTLVHARLDLTLKHVGDVSPIQETIRELREAKLRQDLEDLAAYFTRP